MIHSDDAFAPVGYLNLHRLHLEDKPTVSNIVILKLELVVEISKPTQTMSRR